MDIFYYWKNYDADMRDGRIGSLNSDRHKLGSLKERWPTYIWAFKTPPGRKGELQLLARLVWLDEPKTGRTKSAVTSTIHYDPADPRTVVFRETDAPGAIQEVTSLLRGQYPSAFRANFHGDNGVQVMEPDFLRRFEKLAAKFPNNPFPVPAISE